ncbi:SHOCT domain-containing protein [Chloroflexota bacterium]
MWHFGDGMGWWMPFGWIFMILFWGIVVALVVWVIKRLTQGESSKPTTYDSSDPLDLAEIRYAKGEISKIEFDQIKNDLR